MTEMDIMVFIYKNQKNENWVDINSLFLKEFTSPTSSTFKHIITLLQRLNDEYKFIELADKDYKYLGENLDIYPPEYPKIHKVLFSFEEINRRRQIKISEGNNYGILTKLNFEGRKEVENFLFQQQLRGVNQSVINTNVNQRNLGWATLFIALLSLTAIAFSAYYASKSITAEEFLKTDSILQNNQKVLEKMQQVQKEIGSSLKTMVKLDSLKISKTP